MNPKTKKHWRVCKKLAYEKETNFHTKSGLRDLALDISKNYYFLLLVAVLGDPDDGGGLQQLVQHRAQPDALQPHVHEVQEGSQGTTLLFISHTQNKIIENKVRTASRLPYLVLYVGIA